MNCNDLNRLRKVAFLNSLLCENDKHDFKTNSNQTL